MILARFTDGTFFVGIEQANIDKLKAGHPMQIDLSRVGGSDKVIVHYGNTLADVERELREHFGDGMPAKPSVLPDGTAEHRDGGL